MVVELEQLLDKKNTKWGFELVHAISFRVLFRVQLVSCTT